MQPTPIRRSKKNNTNNILLITFFSIFSCFSGIILGFGGLLFFLQSNPSIYSSLTQQTKLREEQAGLVNPLNLKILNGVVPSGEGFFISNNGQFIKIPEKNNEPHFDFNTLPRTSETKPVFIIRGSNLPLGSLQIKPYYAGIGIDASFSQTGATINAVFENSPAQNANLQTGEIITTINGEPVRHPSAWTPGKADLTGIMDESIQISVLSGTTKRMVELPRSYPISLNDFVEPSLDFSIEAKSDYVTLTLKKELEPGVYRIEFPLSNNYQDPLGNLFQNNPTTTPTIPPIPFPSEKWVFMISK